WRYAEGRLALSDGSFTLADRSPQARFNPLVARGAALALEDNRITAEALLREPQSDRAVTEVELMHDLGSGAGHADLVVGGLLFDAGLQPAASGCAQLASGETVTQPLGLSCLAFGVVSSVRGTITGT